MTLDEQIEREARRADEIRPYLAKALMRAERRREMLEDLARMGMSLAATICNRAKPSPESICDDDADRKDREAAAAKAATDFAAVSRAVRLTLAMEEKLDETIIALRKGRWPREQVREETKARLDLYDVLTRAKAAPEVIDEALDPRAARMADEILQIVAEPLDDPKKDKVREEIFEAIEMTHGIRTLDGERAAMRLHERLVETEAYEAWMGQPFAKVVRLICDDLNLPVDWQYWDDESGFSRTDDQEWDGEKQAWVFKDEAVAEEAERFLQRHRLGPERPSQAEALDPKPQPHALE